MGTETVGLVLNFFFFMINPITDLEKRAKVAPNTRTRDRNNGHFRPNPFDRTVDINQRSVVLKAISIATLDGKRRRRWTNFPRKLREFHVNIKLRPKTNRSHHCVVFNGFLTPYTNTQWVWSTSGRFFLTTHVNDTNTHLDCRPTVECMTSRKRRIVKGRKTKQNRYSWLKNQFQT